MTGCKRTQAHLDAYLHDEVRPRERRRIEDHLAVCTDCGRVLHRLRQLDNVLEQASVPPVPEGLAARVMARARERVTAREPSQQIWPSPFHWWLSMEVPMRLAAAAVLVIGLTVGTFLGRDTWRSGRASLELAGDAAVTDPTNLYGIDLLTEAPDGSLARAYLTLVAADDRKGG